MSSTTTQIWGNLGGFLAALAILTVIILLAVVANRVVKERIPTISFPLMVGWITVGAFALIAVVIRAILFVRALGG